MSHSARLIALLLALTAAAPALAIEAITLRIGRVDGGTWTTGDVRLELAFPADEQLSIQVRSDQLMLPEPFERLRSATLTCPRASTTATGFACTSAELRLSGVDGELGPVPLSLGLDRVGAEWRLGLRAVGLDPRLIWLFAAKHGSLPALEVSAGAVSLSLQLAAGSQAPSAQLDAELAGFDFSDAAGLRAGEGLGAQLAWRLSQIGQHWKSRAELRVDAGQLYVDPVYVDAGATALTLSARADAHPPSAGLRLTELRFSQDSVAAVEGQLDIDAGGELQMLALRLSPAPLAGLYRNYLQPFTIGTIFDALQVNGEADAQLHWEPSAGRRRLQLNVRDVGIADAAERFRIGGIHGHLDWAPSGGLEPTRLSWESGQIYRIDFGAGNLMGRFSGRRFDLDAPLSVPLLGGAVQLDTLEVAAIGTPDLAWTFRGAVQPMSLQALTRSLAWPPFGGTLAGDIPLVSYARGTVTVNGSLDVAVFDGAVRIRNLSIADPFGVIPVLRADVDIHDLSLDALTSAFSFGKIQGRLQGRVHGLALKDWKPTTFDAQLLTPPGDDSRHRISQRAVENLASLGGAGAVLSSTFLRFFEEFSYRRLGISCRLSGGVCEMDGVAPAESGYYIVEGGGLPPRIDVLGFNRRVDWNVLLGRLQQINAAEGPVIR